MSDTSSSAAPIRVLIADDSPFICRLLSGYLQSEPGFEVIGMAEDGRSAIVKAKQTRPDAITLDLEMPHMDGLEALATIMRECPTPVIVISGVSGRAATRTLQALDLGAVDFVLKYSPGIEIDPEQLRLEIRAKVKAASRVRVVRLLGHGMGSGVRSAEAPPQRAANNQSDASNKDYKNDAPSYQGLVIIGASTGGPAALRELLTELPRDFNSAVLVVQHIPKSFTSVLAAQLNRSCPMEVREAEDGDLLRAGLVLVAPGGYHLLVRSGLRVSIVPTKETGNSSSHCPSINVTMQSAAQVLGSRVTGVVLTGMGDDGTEGLQAIHRRGGITFAQDAESCVINGMPQRAIEAGVVDHVASPPKIAALLREQRKQSGQADKREDPAHAPILA